MLIQPKNQWASILNRLTLSPIWKNLTLSWGLPYLSQLLRKNPRAVKRLSIYLKLIGNQLHIVKARWTKRPWASEEAPKPQQRLKEGARAGIFWFWIATYLNVTTSRKLTKSWSAALMTFSITNASAKLRWKNWRS